MKVQRLNDYGHEKMIFFYDCLRYSLFSLVKVYNNDIIYKYMVELSIKGEMTARTVNIC